MSRRPSGCDNGAPSDAEIDEIRDDLLAMAAADQLERADFGAAQLRDRERTARLIEIIDVAGWPFPSLVGSTASNAAWLIVQHSDADPAFQQRVLTLLIEAAEDYDGRGTDIAFLADRVALNTGCLQRFGTQVGCIDGQPVPSPALAEPDRVDDMRREAGLEPLDEYLARFADQCSGAPHG